MFGFFEIDFKKLVLVVLILALPLISLNIERRDAGNAKWYQQPILLIVNPLQEFFTDFSLGVSHTTSFYTNLLNVKRDNRVLKENITTLKQQIAQENELRLEYERLRRLLDFQQISPSKLAASQVIGVDLWSNSEYNSLKINKGSNEGLKKGMAVITHEGVVGYLYTVFPHFSTVLVLTDRNAVIDSLVQRTRARGIVEGLGRDLCHIKYLQRTDDVQVGDLVVTGFDGIFPKGMPIGTVTRVYKKTFGVTQTVEMRPVVDVSRLEEVFVVLAPDVFIERLKEKAPTEEFRQAPDTHISKKAGGHSP
jgi:rod shape-determining protein MreC